MKCPQGPVRWEHGGEQRVGSFCGELQARAQPKGAAATPVLLILFGNKRSVLHNLLIFQERMKIWIFLKK